MTKIYVSPFASVGCFQSFIFLIWEKDPELEDCNTVSDIAVCPHSALRAQPYIFVVSVSLSTLQPCTSGFSPGLSGPLQRPSLLLMQDSLYLVEQSRTMRRSARQNIWTSCAKRQRSERHLWLHICGKSDNLRLLSPCIYELDHS